MIPRSRSINARLTRWRDRHYHTDIVLPTSALLFTEVLFHLGLVSLSIWVYFVALVVLVSAAHVVDRSGTVFVVLALIPLFRLVNLGMPAFTPDVLYWIPVVYSVFLPSIYLLYHPDEGGNSGIGRIQLLLYSAAAVVLGAVLAGIESTVTTVRVVIPNPTITETVLISFVMLVFVSIIEELLFRGVIQQELQSRIGQAGGITLTAALFGTMQATTLSSLSILFGIGLGILLGYVYDRTGSLAIVCILHGSLNVFLYGIFPYSEIVVF